MKRKVRITALIFSLVNENLCLKVSRENNGGFFLPSIDFNDEHDEAELVITDFLKGIGYKSGYTEQLYTFIDKKIIQIGYIVLLKPIDAPIDLVQNDWKWVAVNKIPKLQSPYRAVKEIGIQRLKNKISYSRVAVRLLRNEFTLNDLQQVYEQILGEPLDKRNFRKKVESKNIIKPINKYRRGSHRPARLYKIGPKSKTVPL